MLRPQADHDPVKALTEPEACSLEIGLLADPTLACGPWLCISRKSHQAAVLLGMEELGDLDRGSHDLHVDADGVDRQRDRDQVAGVAQGELPARQPEARLAVRPPAMRTHRRQDAHRARDATEVVREEQPQHHVGRPIAGGVALETEASGARHLFLGQEPVSAREQRRRRATHP